MGKIYKVVDKLPIVGMVQCSGIVFYDRYHKFGMVGHGTLDTKKDTLISMIKMLGDEQRIVEYVIVLDIEI